MTRYLAPAGAPIRAADLARWAGVSLTSPNIRQSLAGALCETFGVRHSALASTGRAGMTLLLRAMHRLSPDRSEVLLPSYTCYSVAASVVKAGLRPRIVDISTRTLDFDPEGMANADFRRVLAVVVTNLYGLPGDAPTWRAIANAHGAFLIDDAAQSMGASVGGRWSGTCGDAGVFSFDKGKPVSAIDGGVVITDSDDISAALDKEMADLHGPSLLESTTSIVKALAYFVLLRPSLYWVPQRIPQLELGKTVFTTDYPLDHPGRPLTALALSSLGHLSEYTQARVANASSLLRQLAAVDGIRCVTPVAGTEPGYLRAPILLDDAGARERLITALHSAGIGASGSYPKSLADVPEVRAALANPNPDASGGRHVAAHLVTLPTHPFVSRADIDRIVAVIASTLRTSPIPARAAVVH